MYFHWFCMLFIHSNSTSSFFICSYTFSKFCSVIVTFQTLQLQTHQRCLFIVEIKTLNHGENYFCQIPVIIWEHGKVLTAYMMLQICIFLRNKSSSVLHYILKLTVMHKCMLQCTLSRAVGNFLYHSLCFRLPLTQCIFFKNCVHKLY